MGTFNANGLQRVNISLYGANYGQNIDKSLIEEMYIPIFNGDVFGIVNKINSLNGNMDIQHNDANVSDGIYGDNALLTDILDVPSDKSLVINPGLDIPGIEKEYGKTGTIAIDNYFCKRLQRALDGVQDNTLGNIK